MGQQKTTRRFQLEIGFKTTCEACWERKFSPNVPWCTRRRRTRHEARIYCSGLWCNNKSMRRGEHETGGVSIALETSSEVTEESLIGRWSCRCIKFSVFVCENDATAKSVIRLPRTLQSWQKRPMCALLSARLGFHFYESIFMAFYEKLIISIFVA